MNNEVKKVLFIINKYAGGGFRPELEGKILDACNQQNIECTIEFTRSRGHATELALAAQELNFKQVVAVGGDGTINEVAKGLLNSTIHMGILPRGSGNGLARHLGIPMQIDLALKSLFSSYPLLMDTFMVNGKLSLNVSGIGFDGHVANLFGQNTKRGLAGYVKLTIKEFIQFKEFKAHVIIDGVAINKEAFIIAIANSSQYGNNARIAPAASVCDQLLNITFLKKVPSYRADFVYALFTGKVNQSKYCEITTTKKIIINLDEPTAYHIDGEPSGMSDSFEIEIKPASLYIMAPNNSILKP